MKRKVYDLAHQEAYPDFYFSEYKKDFGDNIKLMPKFKQQIEKVICLYNAIQYHLRKKVKWDD